MTNQSSLNAARKMIIEKIIGLPDIITKTNMDTFEEYEVSTVEAKPALVAAIENNTDFIPAFSPKQNIDRAVTYSDASKFYDIYAYAVFE